MFKKCPKCGHERGPGETGSEDICAACGLIFSKYLKSRFAPAEPVEIDPVVDAEESWLARARDLAFYVPDEIDALYVYARPTATCGTCTAWRSTPNSGNRR